MIQRRTRLHEKARTKVAVLNHLPAHTDGTSHNVGLSMAEVPPSRCWVRADCHHHACGSLPSHPSELPSMYTCTHRRTSYCILSHHIITSHRIHMLDTILFCCTSVIPPVGYRQHDITATPFTTVTRCRQTGDSQYQHIKGQDRTERWYLKNGSK